MDSAQWPQQGIGVVKEVEGSNTRLQPLGEKRVRPYKEQALNCPRCNSSNTKFCYYNNYSLTQPRYFCKTCRRYWTEGGSLRNVPVGGGSRKNKKPSPSPPSPSLPSSSPTPSPLPSTSSFKFQPCDLISTPPITCSKFYNGQDLNLSFPNQSLAHYELGSGGGGGGSISALELLRSGISARGFGPGADSGSVFGSGFGFQELMRQSNLKLPLGNNGGYGGGMQQMQEGGTGRLTFPFEDLREVQIRNGGHENEENEGIQAGDQSLFWNGGSGGGGGTWS